MSDPTRYPLAWPSHKPRRKASARIRGQFSEGGADGKSKRISLAGACDRLEQEVSRLGGVYPILSSNIELRMDGRPRADRAAPIDPGVALYFQLKGEPYTMACDTFTEAAQNIAALANHIEATRRIERYGVATAAETLHAFQALPPPSSSGLTAQGAPPPGGRPWFEVLQVAPGCSEAVVQASYRALAKTYADDERKLRDLNIARDQALKVLADA